MMLSMHGYLKEDIIIESNTELHGHIRGNVMIVSPSTLFVYGSIKGNILILEGAGIEIHGRIDGDILNKGSFRSIGVVRGQIVNNGGQVQSVNI